LEVQLRYVFDILQLNPKIIRSSSLNVEPEFSGESRIIEILERVGAQEYLNLSGGINLYSRENFEKRRLGINFLEEYRGNKVSIYERIKTENIEELRNELSESPSFI